VSAPASIANAEFGDETMGAALFEIVGTEGAWRIAGAAGSGMSYVTKEAAFEAAVASASTLLKEGRGVVIAVQGSDGGTSALGERTTA
jgi:hypothetical protein